MNKPIVWTIAGSDSSGGAGIQTDLHTFQALGAYGCSVIAALTAQNSQSVSRIQFVSAEMITAQLQALENDLPARAIKMGMLGSIESLRAILPFIKRATVPIIYDPVLFATVGDALHEGNIRQFLLNEVIPFVTMLTPNLLEAEWLLQRSIKTNDELEQAANDLLQLGPQAILLKGGHAKFQQQYCQDYFVSEKEKIWLTSERQASQNNHGTGCSLSSAITACLALEYELMDAVVLAKAYINQGIRLSQQYGKGPGPIAHLGWPNQQNDFPVMTPTAQPVYLKSPFPACETLGFYPIVEDARWVLRLLKRGVKTIQLRIKNESQEVMRQHIAESITYARDYQAQLFINDHWELALELQAYGVHLGQADLQTANLEKILQAGLRLGISTHAYYEVARALAVQPSYIAIGPIYPTTTKIMPFHPQGIATLQRYCHWLHYPIVAIGGINWERLPAVWQTGVSGVAVISAITKAKDPEAEIDKWVNFFEVNSMLDAKVLS